MLIAIFICLLCLLILTGLTLSIDMKEKNKNRLEELSFEQLFEIVNIIINNEISLYERNIFDNGGKILDKSTFDTYYKDIFKNVLDSLSDSLVDAISSYINKESFYTMISRNIMIYLNSKVL